MTFTPPTVTVVTRKAFTIAGLYVATSMANAQTDCPKIWEEEMGPRLATLMPALQASEAFGVSIVTNPVTCDFNYWAGVPLPQGVSAPEGLQTLHIAGGQFLEVYVPSLEALSATYQYIYQQWLPEQNTYTTNLTAPSYERYGSNFCIKPELFLYWPVIAK